MRNLSEVNGAVAVDITSESATVEVEIGSELDGLLYYNWTRGGNPRFGLNDLVHRRFEVEKTGNATYKLTPTTGTLEA